MQLITQYYKLWETQCYPLQLTNSYTFIVTNEVHVLTTFKVLQKYVLMSDFKPFIHHDTWNHWPVFNQSGYTTHLSDLYVTTVEHSIKSLAISSNWFENSLKLLAIIYDGLKSSLSRIKFKRTFIKQQLNGQQVFLIHK